MKPDLPLRQILHSKRANIYYLERVRILVRGGKIEYLTQEGGYWNIPLANTTFLLLGNGASITQAASRMLAKAAVPFGFCAGGGTPLYAAVDVLWVTPQSEYGPTKYMQQWMRMWLDPDQRLVAAKDLQRARIQNTKKWWSSTHFQKQGFNPGSLSSLVEDLEDNLEDSTSNAALLGYEGAATKKLYRKAAKATNHGSFQRKQQGTGVVNQFLTHGNYLAYGCGAVVCWALGIPPSLSVLHGKTRRGGLVYDFADIIKDGVILPQAFISAQIGHTRSEFKGACIRSLMDLGALDTMFKTAQGLIS